VNETKRAGNTKVFLSYAQADKDTARYIADALKRSGVSTLFDEWELQLGDSIVQHIERGVESSDFVLLLLSPAAVQSHWIQKEWSAAFSRELNDRAIRILPVLIADCDVPPILATRVVLDLRTNREAGVQRLVDQLSAAPAIQYSQLTPQDFEKLVADLLVELGFSVEVMLRTRDRGFDLVATYETRDPFGVTGKQKWLVEAKLYRNSRVSVSVLRELLGVLSIEQASMGLIVTNGNLTSEARHFLQAVDRGNRLRLIDGTELTSLIARYPGLVERHFPRSGNRG
jgi:HJR/Mrr/RecB family endonuclease